MSGEELPIDKRLAEENPEAFIEAFLAGKYLEPEQTGVSEEGQVGKEVSQPSVADMTTRGLVDIFIEGRGSYKSLQRDRTNRNPGAVQTTINEVAYDEPIATIPLNSDLVDEDDQNQPEIVDPSKSRKIARRNRFQGRLGLL